jgi:ABC-type uncharacterized transport system permease subunit
MIESIVLQILIMAPLLMGAYLSISLLKVPDLSLESAYLFGAVMGGLTGDNPGAFFAAAGGGAMVGFLTSFFNQVARLPFLLAAIVVNGLFHGTALLVMKGAILPVHADLKLPELILAAISVGTIFFLLLRSQLGYAFAIYGNNPLFFRRHNISTRYVVMAGTALASSAAGLSGYLFAGSSGFVDITLGLGVVLLSLTSLMLGKVVVQRPSLLMPCVGIVIYFLLQHGLLKAGFPLKYFNAVQAAVVLGVWVFSRRKQPLLNHLGV